MTTATLELPEEVVDDVMEYLGMKMRKSHIKQKLREVHPEISTTTIELLITAAKKKIVEVFKCDPQEFKGSAIEFYSSIIRNPKNPLKYRIICQQRLDCLLNLENIETDDPQEFADKIRSALGDIDETVTNATLDEA